MPLPWRKGNEAMAINAFSELVIAFAELSKRLLENEVKMGSLKILSGGCGSWEMVAQKGEEAFRFSFDGKDSILYVEKSRARPNLVPNEWTSMENKSFSERRKSEIAYTEEFLRNKFAGNSN
jgi:hypothetical protein